MGDDDEATSEALEFMFEPFDRVDVKVVGRLVEHEQVGVRDEGSRSATRFS